MSYQERNDENLLGFDEQDGQVESVQAIQARLEQNLRAVGGFDETDYNSSQARKDDWETLESLKDMTDAAYHELMGRMECGDITPRYGARKELEDLYAELNREYNEQRQSL